MISEEVAIQIAKTLELLSSQYTLEPSKVLASYISRYEKALKSIQGSTEENIDIKLVKPLLNLSRGYLEASSNYQKSFLIEMANTENLLKQYTKKST